MLVSFIIPTFNSERTIKECLESIKEQKCKKEIIVVDGDSHDRTKEIVKEITKKLIIEKRKGIAVARNTGLRNAEGKYIAFVDSDVVLPKSWLTKALKLLRSDERIAAVGGPGLSPEKSLVSKSLNSLLFGHSSLIERKFVDSLATMDVLYKKRDIQGMFFDESMFAGEDPEFNFRLRKKNLRLLYDRELWVYHYHPTNFKGLFKKWYNYGKSYPLLGYKHKELRNIRFYVRLLYMPLFFILIFSSLFFHHSIYLACLQILIIFFYYSNIGIKTCRGFVLLAFPFIHTSKQISHMLGHIVGLITLLIRK